MQCRLSLGSLESLFNSFVASIDIFTKLKVVEVVMKFLKVVVCKINSQCYFVEEDLAD